MNRPNGTGDAAVLGTDRIESRSVLTAGRPPRRSSTRPSLCLLIGTVPALLAGSLIVGARLSTMLRMRSLSIAVAAGLVVVAVVVVVASAGGRQPRQLLHPARPSAGELMSLGAVGVAALLVLRRMSGFSFFSPMVYSVDAAHHSAIVTWIVDHGAIPSGYVAQFATYEYPPWAHLCAAVLSEIAHVQPITGLWLTAIGAIALQAPLMMATTRALSPDREISGSRRQRSPTAAPA